VVNRSSWSVIRLRPRGQSSWSVVLRGQSTFFLVVVVSRLGRRGQPSWSVVLLDLRDQSS